MADSLLDLGSTAELFTLKPEWSGGVGSSVGFGRQVLQHNLGTISVRSLTNDLPRRVSYDFKMLTKVNEYYLVNFFCTQRGRNKRFWLPLWQQDFQLASAITQLSYTFTITDNHFADVVRYYERVFIYTKTGDMITRKILTSVGNTFTVETAFDRDIALTDVLYFGLLLMARFDVDELNIKHITDRISETTVDFFELPKEYETSTTGS